MKRDTRQAYRRRAADTERRVDEAVAEVRAERAADFRSAKERAAARRAELAAKPAVDRDSIRPGAWVLNRRLDAGRVVQLNAKTVSVKTNDGFDGRWPYESIIATKEATS